jgi:hypothetical protein
MPSKGWCLGTPRRRGRRIPPRVIALIGQARREFEYGAQRTQIWLRRVHEVRVAVGPSSECSATSACQGCGEPASERRAR